MRKGERLSVNWFNITSVGQADVFERQQHASTKRALDEK
jgi:hypothetical protein